jgi:NAD-dependent dihydropyrimidine dehydrogenase PreA subunit
MSVSYDTKNVIKGFTDMTEMFTIYGAKRTVADFYNSFRYNTTPIGIGNFSTYLQLKVAAPELEGLWGIAMVPGTKQSDGTVKIDDTMCTGCGLCANLCKFGAIELVKE